MNTRRQFLRASLGVGAAISTGAWRARLAEGDTTAAAKPADAWQRVTKAGRALGTEVKMTVLDRDPQRAQRALDAAFEELRLVERLMSIYRRDSQLSRLNRSGHLPSPHPYLCEVLRCAAAVSAQSGGAFDITVQPFWQVHAEAQRLGRAPSPNALTTAAAQVDWRCVQLDDDSVTLRKPASAVTLNGIAQGFAADRAKAALFRHGVRHALIDTGELSCLGRKPEGAWKVGVQHPRRSDAFAAVVELGSRSLATSGDYATTFDNDRRRHHLFDPRTGDSPQCYSSVSVAAPTAMEADALSTALFAMNLEQAWRLLRDAPRVDALLVLKEGRALATKGFPQCG